MPPPNDADGNNPSPAPLAAGNHPPPRPVPGIKPPAPLITDSKYLPENWKQKWNNYKILTALNQHPREYQVALLLHTLGDDALRIYNGLSFDTPEDTRTVDQIVTAFDSFAMGEVNETYERYIFNQRYQDESESLNYTCQHCANL